MNTGENLFDRVLCVRHPIPRRRSLHGFTLFGPRAYNLYLDTGRAGRRGVITVNPARILPRPADISGSTPPPPVLLLFAKDVTLPGLVSRFGGCGSCKYIYIIIYTYIIIHTKDFL
jgi:hypothetical protein